MGVCVNTESIIGLEDSEQAEATAAAAAAATALAKQPTLSVQGSQGLRVAKAVTKLEEKKQKRVTRQEQVIVIYCIYYLRV